MLVMKCLDMSYSIFICPEYGNIQNKFEDQVKKLK